MNAVKTPVAGEQTGNTAASPQLREVRDFWNRNPLFTGTSRYEPGEKEFFEEHFQFALSDQGGAINPIFLRDVIPGREVLDVGCGIGLWVHQFCLRGARVSACDLSDSSIALTRRRIELYGLCARICQGNAEQLPYSAASYDHVNCLGVIHHTPNTEQCLQEFHRVLRPHGTLCFSVYYRVLPLRSRVAFRVVSLVTRPWLGMKGRGREHMMAASSPEELVRLYDGADNPLGKAYSREEVHSMLAGRFEILEEKRLGLPRSALRIPLPDLLFRALSRMFGLMIILRCRKKENSR